MALKKRDLKPGTVLANDATVLLHKGDEDEEATVFAVLCVLEGQFVTWDYYENDGLCRAGDYFGGNLQEALTAFQERK